MNILTIQKPKNIKICIVRNILYFENQKKESWLIKFPNHITLQNNFQNWIFITIKKNNNLIPIFKTKFNTLKKNLNKKDLVHIQTLGTGYLFEEKDQHIELSLGWSHQLGFEKKEGIKVWNQKTLIWKHINSTSLKQQTIRIHQFKKKTKYQKKGLLLTNEKK